MGIRGSQLPLLAQCAASAHSKVSINTTSEASKDGTEGHDLARCHIMGLPHAEPSSDSVATSHERFKENWASLNVSDVKTEVEVSLAYDGIIYTGHIDFLCNDGNLIIDLKTGRGESDYRPQLIGYAKMWLSWFPFWGKDITIAIINSTTGTVWYETLSFAEVDTEFDRIHHKIKNWNGAYSVGDWCKYCPARLFCQANITSLNSALALVGESEISKTINPEVMVKIYPLIGQLESRLKAAKDFIRNEVEMQGGKIESESGTLELQTISKGEVIPKECASFLTEWIGSDKLFDILKIGKGELERAMIEQFKFLDPLEIDEGEWEDIYLKDRDGNFVLKDDGSKTLVNRKIYRYGEPELTKKDAKGNLKHVSQDEFKKWLNRKLQSLDALVITTTQKLTFKASKPKEIEA